MQNETSQITEQQVAAWIVERAKALNLPDIEINVYVSKHAPDKARFIVECRDSDLQGGDTLSEAVSKLLAKRKTAEQLATEKREKAAKLIAEANALVGPAVTV